MKKLIILFVCILILTIPCKAQDPLFSQFQYSPLLINPAYAAADYDLQFWVHYRNQFRTPDPSYRTPSFSFLMPFLNKNSGHRFGGIGVSAFSDQSGSFPFRLVNQGMALTYAHNIFMGDGFNLSLGLQGGYYHYGIIDSEVTTGKQYVNNGGFDPNRSTGENFNSNISINYLDIGTGVHFTKEDSIGRKFFIGISLFHLNRPNLAFQSGTNTLPFRYTGHVGFRAYSNKNLLIIPEALASFQSPGFRISVGSRFNYLITKSEEDKSKFWDKTTISLIPRYILNNGVAVGVELCKSNFVIALNYDFNTSPLADRINTTGAYELVVGYRRFIGKIKQKIVLPDYTIGDIRKFYSTDNIKEISKKLEDERKNNVGSDDQASDADTNWNKTGDYRFGLEKRFTYGFNETGMGVESKKFADELVAIMKDNNKIKLVIIGYTDNVGTEEVNLYISKERAKAFANYIESKGINPSRLKFEGKGETEPLNTNKSSRDRAKNRRVRFLLY